MSTTLVAVGLYLSGCGSQEQECKEEMEYTCLAQGNTCSENRFATPQGCLEITLSCMKLKETCEK